MGVLTFTRTQKNYGKFYLRSNPFPHAGIPEENPGFCADREKELASISETILTSLDGHSVHMALLGGYGNGKTHTLKYVKSEINRQLNGNGNARALASFVMTPGLSFVDLYRNFMQDLGLDFFLDRVWELLGVIAVEEIEHRRKAFQNLNREVKQRIRNNPKIIREYVDEGTVLLSSLTKAYREKLLSIVKSVDVVNAFLQLLAEETSLLAWKWISGEQTMHEQRKEIGVVSAINTDDKALSVFLGVKSILRELAYRALCLLVDEFENIETLFPQQKQRFLNSVRHLIDLNPTGLCLIISCTPEVWKTIVREYHAFSERIFKEVLLKPLNEATLRNLIAEYVQRHRTGQNGGIGQLYPFSDDSIRPLLEFSQGNMRRALSICNISIDIATETNSETITGDFLKTALERLS